MTTRKGAEELSQAESLLELLRKFGSLPLALTKDEAARQLSIGRTALDRLINYGLIRVIYYEENGHPRILRSEIERFLSERMDEASHPPHGARQSATTRRVKAGSPTDAEQEVAKLRALRRKRRV